MGEDQWAVSHDKFAMMPYLAAAIAESPGVSAHPSGARVTKIADVT